MHAHMSEIRFFFAKFKSGNLKGLGVDGRIILKGIIRFMCEVTVGGILWT